MNPYEVLVRPILSEKSNREREGGDKYTFEIKRDASKPDVKAAVEKLFEVKVEKVTTCLTRGKHRRRGMHWSQNPGMKKKAVVTLVEGAKIPLFEDL